MIIVLNIIKVSVLLHWLLFVTNSGKQHQNTKKVYSTTVVVFSGAHQVNKAFCWAYQDESNLCFFFLKQTGQFWTSSE